MSGPQTNIAGFKDAEEAQACRQSVEAGLGGRVDSLLEPPEGMQIC